MDAFAYICIYTYKHTHTFIYRHLLGFARPPLPKQWQEMVGKKTAPKIFFDNPNDFFGSTNGLDSVIQPFNANNVEAFSKNVFAGAEAELGTDQAKRQHHDNGATHGASLRDRKYC